MRSKVLLVLTIVSFGLFGFIPQCLYADFKGLFGGSKGLDPSNIVHLREESRNFFRVNPDGSVSTQEYIVPLGKVFIITAITHSTGEKKSVRATLYQRRILPDPASSGKYRMILQTESGGTKHYTFPSGIVIAPGHKLYLESSGATPTNGVHIFGYEVSSE